MQASGARVYNDLDRVRYRNWTSSINAFKSDKLMDALFREGQSGPQTPQTVFDADFEGLTSNAELYIFNQEDSQE